MNTLATNKKRKRLQENIKDRGSVLGSYVKEYDKGQADAYFGEVKCEKRLDIVIGIPGSGKSSAIANPLSEYHKSVIIDPDWVKPMLPEYDNGKGSGIVHQESKNIADEIFESSLKENKNIVLPVVGKTYDHIIEKIKLARKCGYSVNVHYCEISLEESLKRVKAREARTGRGVNEDYIKNEVGNKPKENYNSLLVNGLCDRYYEYNNEVELGEPAKVVRKHYNIEGKIKTMDFDNVRMDDRVLIEENNGLTLKTIAEYRQIIAKRRAIDRTDSESVIKNKNGGEKRSLREYKEAIAKLKESKQKASDEDTAKAVKESKQKASDKDAAKVVKEIKKPKGKVK